MTSATMTCLKWYEAALVNSVTGTRLCTYIDSKKTQIFATDVFGGLAFPLRLTLKHRNLPLMREDYEAASSLP